ncbi:MAG TPA: YHS domain-containing protein [Methylomirabilota bacterium]|jgi:Cu+-exporting ATPase
MEKDPVCGMVVKTDEAGGRSEHQGKHYFFCSVACKERFDRNPQTFVVKKMLDEDTVTQADKR